MTKLTEAEQYLLDRIANGDSEGWSQLVERYQGRLLAFACSRLSQPSDAEDVVQETFLAFIKNIASFRGQSSIETFLFSILRRKLVDLYRGRKITPCLIQDTFAQDNDSRVAADGFAHLPAADPTASTYARRDEQHGQQRDILTAALTSLLEETKKKLNFRDLQIAELVFYAQLRNKQIAELLEIDEKQIALIKHRLLKRISQHVEKSTASQPVFDCTDAMLTEVWESARPSCPKRSTLGRYVLQTLDSDWHQYIDFHLNALGCRFCRANHEDLAHENEAHNDETFRDRIFQSTIGFLSHH